MAFGGGMTIEKVEEAESELLVASSLAPVVTGLARCGILVRIPFYALKKTILNLSILIHRDFYTIAAGASGLEHACVLDGGNRP